MDNMSRKNTNDFSEVIVTGQITGTTCPTLAERVTSPQRLQTTVTARGFNPKRHKAFCSNGPGEPGTTWRGALKGPPSPTGRRPAKAHRAGPSRQSNTTQD